MAPGQWRHHDLHGQVSYPEWPQATKEFQVLRDNDINRPTVPVAYVHLSLQLAEERGFSADELVADLGFDAELLSHAEARIGLMDYGRLCLLVMHRCQEPGLGFEFGLRTNVTVHGFYGFGVMSQATVREAFEFAARFAPLRTPGWSLRLLETEQEARLIAEENVPFGKLRQYAQEMMLSSHANSYLPLLNVADKAELLFDCAEPAYFSKYASRLPPCRFNAGEIAISIPTAALERPIPTANAVTARLVGRHCEAEMTQLGLAEDWLSRVRSLLNRAARHYPSQDELARLMSMSTRSFRRKLKSHQVNYRALIDETRKREAIRLLEDPGRSLEEVAERVGFSSPSNLSRAFIRWTGIPPGQFRRQQK